MGNVEGDKVIETITLMSDYGCFGWKNVVDDDELGASVGGCVWIAGLWGDENDLIPEDLKRRVEAWHEQFETFGWHRMVERPREFDWKSYHARGIALCHELKRALGSNVRVVYE